MPEDRILEAIRLAHDYVRQICAMQEELAQKAFAVKKPYDPPSGGVLDTVRTNYYDAFRAAKQTIGKLARADACQAVKEKALGRDRPRPGGRGAPRRRLPRPGRSWKAASSAT